MRSYVCIVLIFTTIFLASCASIVSDSKYPVTVDSPRDGELTITDSKGIDYYEGSVPATVTLSASSGFFQYATYTAKLDTSGDTVIEEEFSGKLDPFYVGNLIFGGAIGFLIVDPATGAMWKLEDTVEVTLGPNKPKQVENKDPWKHQPAEF